MKALSNGEKRGRPDIIHFALLEALGSPLNIEGLLKVYVHALNDYVIDVNPKTRLPRNYERFIGLIEQLFELHKVPPSGPALLRLERKSLPDLIKCIEPDYVMIFDEGGVRRTVEEAVRRFSDRRRPVVIVGGFPSGRFTETTLKLADEVVCIDPEVLEAWVVVTRVIYEYERMISLPWKRLSERYYQL